MSAAEMQTVVTSAANEIGLLDDHGNLVALDSLMMIDFVIALEVNVGMQIPVSLMRPELFSSIDAVSNMLTELRRTTEAPPR